MADPLIASIAFVFGACIGSFLNVCIHRLPAAESIIFPGSHCPACRTPIRFYDNIPLLSFLLLKGRCRACNAPISWRYPGVELLSGLLAAALYYKYQLTFSALIYFLFSAALIVITFIDIDQRIIPDVITLPGIPLAFLAALVLPQITYKDSLIGLILGGGILFVIGWVYMLLKKIEGMGGGDIKLLAMIGALLGLKGVVFTIFVASAVGTLVGLAWMLRTRQGMKLAIPFGPFLALGAVAHIFFGPEIIHWYLWG